MLLCIGFTSLWVQQGITSFLLFCLICVASVLYEFYGDWWNVDERTEYPPGEDDGSGGGGGKYDQKVVPVDVDVEDV
mgnify:CR=1 FL=1